MYVLYHTYICIYFTVKNSTLSDQSESQILWTSEAATPLIVVDERLQNNYKHAT